MRVGFRAFDDLHHLGDSATHPIRPASGALAALLLVRTRARGLAALGAAALTLASPPDDDLLGRAFNYRF
jgi:hypothetical protein